MLTEKKSFQIERLRLKCGDVIPITVGYETYGTLNEQKDNAILVAHYFSATSHCAGKYSETDVNKGYWDAIIGPSKAVDTNKYFVISVDNLCNTQPFNPRVITTGPAAINPATGKPYGMGFPVVDTKDCMEVQKRLIDALGIKKLKCVMGPSAGGMITFQWAVNYPHMMDKCIGVITNAQHPILTSFIVLQQALRAGRMDPNFNGGDYYGKKDKPVEGLRLAAQMMSAGAYTPAYYERTYPRNSLDTEPYRDVNGTAGYEKALYSQVAANTEYSDLNSWIYTCRMTMNHDIAHGYESLDEALSCIKAEFLLIPNKQDLLHPWEFNVRTAERINQLGGEAYVYPIDSDLGHMAGILQAELFADKIREFLS